MLPFVEVSFVDLNWKVEVKARWPRGVGEVQGSTARIGLRISSRLRGDVMGAGQIGPV